MKKLFLIVLVLFIGPFLVLLISNKDPFEESMEVSREFNLVGKNVERDRIEVEREERLPLPTVDYRDFEKRDYILLKSLPNGRFEISLHLNYDLVCTWEGNLTDPRLWEDRTELYFAAENCPSMNDSILTWYIHQNFGVLKTSGIFVKEVRVYTLIQNEYDLLEIK